MALPDPICAVLVDIEGTTTPISFVYDTLFPFAASRVAHSCARAGDDPRIAEAVELLRHECEGDEDYRVEGAGPFGDGADYAAYLMRKDRKSTGLKALQGVIWEEGYRSGSLLGEVFDDVPPALEAWRATGIRMRVFSSGSVLAQRLLFAHTRHGDLSVFFEGHHDTTTGPKQQPIAYRRIADAFDLGAERILFLSDVVAELDAASAAGMATGLMLRPGNPPTASGPHLTYRDFGPLLERVR